MTTARYINEHNTLIEVMPEDGRPITIAANPEHAIYKKLVADGVTIQPFNG